MRMAFGPLMLTPAVVAADAGVDDDGGGAVEATLRSSERFVGVDMMMPSLVQNVVVCISL